MNNMKHVGPANTEMLLAFDYGKLEEFMSGAVKGDPGIITKLRKSDLSLMTKKGPHNEQRDVMASFRLVCALIGLKDPYNNKKMSGDNYRKEGRIYSANNL